MTPRLVRGVLGAAALAFAGAAIACGDGLGPQARQIDSAQVLLKYQPAPDPVTVGRHFAIDFAVCPRGAGTAPRVVSVDAHMPDHKHGMNYKPSIVSLGQGLFRAEGLMFHMPGRWELVFELRGDGAPVRLLQSLQID